MFKVGDEVVAVKRKDYEATKTEHLYCYTEDMRDSAESQKVMKIQFIKGRCITCQLYDWHMDDLMLAVPEDLENV